MHYFLTALFLLEQILNDIVTKYKPHTSKQIEKHNHLCVGMQFVNPCIQARQQGGANRSFVPAPQQGVPRTGHRDKWAQWGSVV